MNPLADDPTGIVPSAPVAPADARTTLAGIPEAHWDVQVETLALALLTEAERNPAQTITDRAKATLYYMSEARRRIDLLRQRARDAVAGDDPERAAIQAEEADLLTIRVQPFAFTNGLLLAATPLAGTPGARPCRSCGRGIWCSPSWRGPLPPDLCAECFRKPPP